MRYGELLYRYARSRGADHADAEDVVQEVEMYLFKAMEGFEYDTSKGRFRAYLRSAVAHALSRRFSKEAREAAVIDPHNFDYLASEKEASADARWEREWQLHRLRWAMRSIAGEFDPPTLEAFEMYALAGRSVAETADKLRFSKASVYQAKSRVLKRLKERLEDLDPDGNV